MALMNDVSDKKIANKISDLKREETRLIREFKQGMDIDCFNWGIQVNEEVGIVFDELDEVRRNIKLLYKAVIGEIDLSKENEIKRKMKELAKENNKCAFLRTYTKENSAMSSLKKSLDAIYEVKRLLETPEDQDQMFLKFTS